ncbi:MAG: PAS domain S-box protein [bacterium]
MFTEAFNFAEPAKAKLEKLNEVFSSLSNDFDKNIQLITTACGEALDAQIALYNRVCDCKLFSIGRWNFPETYEPINLLDNNICSEIIKSGIKNQVYIIRNFNETYYCKSDPNLVNYGIKTYIGNPVVSYDEIVGVLCALYTENIELEDKHKLIISILAKVIGIEEENRQISELNHIQRDLGISLTSLSSLDEALPICVNCALKAGKMDCGAIYLVDENENLKLSFITGVSEQFTDIASFFSSDSSQARLIMKGKPIYSQHRNLGIDIDKIRLSEQLKAMAIIPVKFEGKAIACLIIASHTLEEVPFYTRHTLETMATQIGSFIARVKAENEVYKHRNRLDEFVKERTSELIMLNEQLKESEEKYRNFVERANDGIVILQDFIIKYLNTRMAEMGGYTYDEIINTPFIKYVHPDYRDTIISRYKARLEGRDVPPVYEAVLMAKDGREIYVEINAGKIIHYGKPADLIIIRDITERKQKERALAIEKEKLQVTLNSIGDGVIATDIEGKITLINKMAETLTGWTKDEVLDKHLTDIFYIKDFNDQTRNENIMEIMFRNNEISNFIDKTILVCKDGSTKFISNSISLIYDSEDKVIGFVLVFHDITEKLKIENELAKAQRIESIGLLAGGIAHDFNNILTAIMGNISLAKMYMDPKDKIYERLTDAENASERAKRLAQKLLTFASGGAPIMKTTEIVKILRDSVDFALSGSNIKCEYHIKEDLWLVDIDESQISQAINNIVVNACQAMPNGGNINLFAENVTIESKVSTLLKTGKYVKITIEDFGSGIAEDILPKIFDPYFTTKRNCSGLGLTIAYSIIRRHGGNIEVSSSYGKGTVISIYLPVSTVNATKEKHSDIISIRNKGKVLIMDDEKMIRDITSKILEINGYEIATANDGLQAIDLYKKAMESGKPFNVVILDLTVPGGMGGEETIKRLIDIDPEVKAIVSSGYSNDPVIENYRQIGFKGFIYKPYSSRELINIVDYLIIGNTNLQHS